ncbi:MAG TPA: nickel pincer cofactor biosynthesis protein LarB [Thermodesulfobacteriota bacterium]|nr:nickel pincer cofactor biosynthesis protein LarB [Thermodesulfobacteriota bacterium]
MNPERLKKLLNQVKVGKVSVDEAVNKMKHLPFEDIDFAQIDHHRSLRKGFPEVIFGEGKTAEQVMEIMGRMTRNKENLLVTRLDAEKAEAVQKKFPNAVYHPLSRVLTIIPKSIVKKSGGGLVLVISAGTSDIPVAEEAFLTAQIMGNQTEYLYDVGIAGLHRLIAKHEKVLSASVLIVVAGMEGALPSVVGGLVDRPVIAVPTSIGYGASFNGLAALLGMLNSCASGVAVVNIDNGFGAGYLATLINRV